jgi:CheY-like chemotaxis protein
MRIRPDLPVIVCTGYSQSLDQARAAGMGIQGFVMKPIQIDEIAAAVRKVLEKKSPPAGNLRP